MQYAGSIEPFPGKEPTPRDLQKLAEQLKASGARAVFSETLLPAAPAEALAEAISVPVVELDPACGNSGRDYRDYEDWLNYNAGLILDALTPASSAAPAAASH
ncbi:zinc ABC transporter substrate-binding protein [bacterium]|nr:zinc ABC transporter substrate-binding protein [bacterium]